MHRCCDSHISLIIKNVRQSPVLDLWKCATYSTTDDKLLRRHHVDYRKSPQTNHRTCRSSANAVERSCLFVNSRVSHATLPTKSACAAQQVRFINLPIPFKRKQDFRALDKIPGEYKCIYNAAIHIYISYFYPAIAFATLAALLPLVVHGIGPDAFLPQNRSDPVVFFRSGSQVMSALPFAISMVFTAKYFAYSCPMRIYANEDDEFIAVFATVFPWRTTKCAWKPCDVTELHPMDDEKITIFKALRGRYVVGKKRLILFPHAFKYPHHYNTLLGNTLEYMYKKEQEMQK